MNLFNCAPLSKCQTPSKTKTHKRTCLGPFESRWSLASAHQRLTANNSGDSENAGMKGAMCLNLDGDLTNPDTSICEISPTEYNIIVHIVRNFRNFCCSVNKGLSMAIFTNAIKFVVPVNDLRFIDSTGTLCF